MLYVHHVRRGAAGLRLIFPFLHRQIIQRGLLWHGDIGDVHEP